MFDVNSIPLNERIEIITTLAKWGISIDQKNGKIDYIADFTIPEVNANSIYLIRHAETIAVSKHEFMSDVSENCGLTEKGIEITRRQAEKLDAYDFDVALYGPIDRVIDTLKIIQERPQKFSAIKMGFLRGIDNSGWEYKSYCDLEDDQVFIAREVEFNIFARTPYGTSWGMVIVNCDRVLEYINKNCSGMNVLLVSQGSVLRGMQILLRNRKHPWDDYSATDMYHIGVSRKKEKDYGIINKIL